MEIEADADSMIEYEAQAVPGLLRTEDYAALCCGWDEP
ncbi:Scr1 family TA system antitoxin-like transcriptional regulator [Actinomadura formosensis]|nr:Scr1 family TA system antitoxin-like transcriptional regulator [Actinomadura formosensis]